MNNSTIIIANYLRINFWKRNVVFTIISLMSVMICNTLRNSHSFVQSMLTLMISQHYLIHANRFSKKLMKIYLLETKFILSAEIQDLFGHTCLHNQFRYGNVVNYFICCSFCLAYGGISLKQQTAISVESQQINVFHGNSLMYRNLLKDVTFFKN